VTTMAHTWKPSPAQVEFIANVFRERVSPEDPQAKQLWENVRSVSNSASFQTVINALKARPRVQPKTPITETLPPAKPVTVELPKLATEEGLYRDPADGTLYRISIPAKRNSWGSPSPRLSVYSNKAVYRRLTPEGRMVKKGKWNQLKSFDRDALLSFNWRERKGMVPVGKKVLASWLLNDEEKTEWAVGICLMCYKGLVDAVSVYNSIGPVCARNWGVALQMPPEA